MPNGQKQDNLYKSLAIFACSALIFTLIGISVNASFPEIFDKEINDDLTAEEWNHLEDLFLFKNPISGVPIFQQINDNIGINRAGDSNFDLRAQNDISARLFSGSITAANVSSGTFGTTSLGADGHYTFPANLNVDGNIIGGGNILTQTGKVGGNELCLWDTDSWSCEDDWDNIITNIDELWLENGDTIHIYDDTKRVGIGTNDVPPDYLLDVDGQARFINIVMLNEDPTNPEVFPVINMGDGRITNLDKITVGTIDPLYRIDGINYSTFASAIVGGVKEEYISRAFIDKKNSRGEYEHVIDFSKVKRGSELWVWYYTVDFNKDNIEVLITPYGSFAQNYYLIEGDKLILRSDKPVEVSYRLMGKRFDWKSWPLKADDQEEAPSFIINTK